MKKLIFFVFLLLIILNVKTYSQDTTIVNYFPMNVGNVWIYNCSAFGNICFCSKKIRVRITGTVIKNSKTYYLFQYSEIIINCGGGGCGWHFILLDTNRIDPITGNILKYSQNACNSSTHEVTCDSLKSKLNDTIKANCFSLQDITCHDTNSTVVFGINRPSRSYGINYVDSYWFRKYSKGIGPTGCSDGGQSCMSNTTIQGCIVNGVLFGDTTFLTGIKQISTEIPDKFSLSQNYPNPFNPFTNIKFAIPFSNKGLQPLVLIKVYDLLGKEVAVLVNEALQPGSYEINWDASNFPSGIYFYKIASGSFVETKKMMLVK